MTEQRSKMRKRLVIMSTARKDVSELDKNLKFVQLADPDGIKAMRVLTKRNPAAAALFYALMEYIDKDNCLVASTAVLSAKMGVSASTVTRSVRYLRVHKYIAVLKSGSTNVYVLNSEIVWRDKGYKKAEALLQGSVLLSLDEQDDETKVAAHKQMHQLNLV